MTGSDTLDRTIVYTRSLSSAFKEGQELNEKDQTAIKTEIEKLQNLLPKEEVKEEVKEPEPQSEPETPPEETKEEEQPKEEEPSQEQIDALLARLEAAEQILNEE